MSRRPQEPDQEIGRRIRQLRRALDYSQDSVAQTMGPPFRQTTISKIERGQRPVLARELLALADILGVSTEWLLSGEE